jgi:phosphoribosylamine--glycine ligase
MLARLECDIVPYILAAASGNMASLPPLRWSNQAAVCIVVVSGPYPGEVPVGLAISGIATALEDPNVRVYHAGTRATPTGPVTTGGRVINVVGLGGTIGRARARAQMAAPRVQFSTARYRSDIALKAAREEALAPKAASSE